MCPLCTLKKNLERRFVDQVVRRSRRLWASIRQATPVRTRFVNEPSVPLDFGHVQRRTNSFTRRRSFLAGEQTPCTLRCPDSDSLPPHGSMPHNKTRRPAGLINQKNKAFLPVEFGRLTGQRRRSEAHPLLRSQGEIDEKR